MIRGGWGYLKKLKLNYYTYYEAFGPSITYTTVTVCLAVCKGMPPGLVNVFT